MIVASVVASLLLGVVGSTATTSLVVYSDTAATISVQGVEYELFAGETRAIPVEFPVRAGNQMYVVLVESSAVSYELPVTVSGTRSWSWLWLAPAPVLIAGSWFVIRRRGAGSS